MAENEDLFPPMFWIAVQRRQTEGQRFGQAVFNTAQGLFPDLVGEIVATEWDPFYNDERVDKFLSGLRNRLRKDSQQ
jgi:hypothetical protein